MKLNPFKKKSSVIGIIDKALDNGVVSRVRTVGLTVVAASTLVVVGQNIWATIRKRTDRKQTESTPEAAMG